MTGNFDLRKVGLMICLSCFVLSGLRAQSRKLSCKGFQDSVLHKFVYTQADVMPEPEGGMEALVKIISKNINCPDINSSPPGKIIVYFVVETNGSIDESPSRKPVNKNCDIAGQVLRIIKQVKWKPGRCGKKAVPCLWAVPLIIDWNEG